MDKQTHDDFVKQDVLVRIGDLRCACYALNCADFEVLVVATGSMWATLKLDFPMRKGLTADGINWQFDQ